MFSTEWQIATNPKSFSTFLWESFIYCGENYWLCRPYTTVQVSDLKELKIGAFPTFPRVNWPHCPQLGTFHRDLPSESGSPGESRVGSRERAEFDVWFNPTDLTFITIKIHQVILGFETHSRGSENSGDHLIFHSCLLKDSFHGQPSIPSFPVNSDGYGKHAGHVDQFLWFPLWWFIFNVRSLTSHQSYCKPYLWWWTPHVVMGKSSWLHPFPVKFYCNQTWLAGKSLS